MKLFTTELEIPDDDPFRFDVLDRKPYAESLTNLIKNIEDPIVVALDANWGEGKTTFAKMWSAQLRAEGFAAVYFDAFQHDFSDDAFVPIVGEIVSYASTKMSDDSEQLQRLTKKAALVGFQLLTWTAKLGVKAATLGIIKDSELDDLQDIKGDIASSASSFITGLMQDKIAHYQREAASILEFKAQLTDLANAVTESTEGKMVVFIDELDRCKPSFAVQVIERIKHLFAVENLLFVLVLNKFQLEESIRAIYGSGIDAHTYLQKFISIETQLPKKTQQSARSDYNVYYGALFDQHSANFFGDDKMLLEHLPPITTTLGLSLRQMQKVVTYILIFYGAVTDRHLRIPQIIAFAATVRASHPNVFEELRHNRIRYGELLQSIPELTQSREDNVGLTFILEWVQMATLSPEEYDALPDDSEVKNCTRHLTRYRSNREIVFPHHCNMMSVAYVPE